MFQEGAPDVMLVDNYLDLVDNLMLTMLYENVDFVPNIVIVNYLGAVVDVVVAVVVYYYYYNYVLN